MKVSLLPINKLKNHEKVNPKRVRELEKLIVSQGKFVKPIVAEKESLVLLDGHHRLAAMKNLGFTKIPVRLVSYRNIKVELRHKNLPTTLIKELVLLSAERGNLLPKKTTKHYLSVFSRAYNLSILK